MRDYASRCVVKRVKGDIIHDYPFIGGNTINGLNFDYIPLLVAL